MFNNNTNNSNICLGFACYPISVWKKPDARVFQIHFTWKEWTWTWGYSKLGCLNVNIVSGFFNSNLSDPKLWKFIIFEWNFSLIMGPSFQLLILTEFNSICISKYAFTKFPFAPKTHWSINSKFPGHKTENLNFINNFPVKLSPIFAVCLLYQSKICRVHCALQSTRRRKKNSHKIFHLI